MGLLFFPIEKLKKIESWLVKYYNFERSMLNNNLIYVYKVYAENMGQFMPREEELYLLEPPKRITLAEHPSLNSKTINLSDQYECAMNVGKNVALDLGEYDRMKIADMYFEGFKEDYASEEDCDILDILIVMAAICHKHRISKGYFDFGEILVSEKQLNYSYNVRPDLLKLYEMFHSPKRIKNNSIRIEYNNEVITLDNSDSWFTNMITPYLDKYLGAENLEEVQTELEEDYPDKKSKGRKKINHISDIMLMGTCNLLQHSSIAEKGKTLTNKQAEFLLNYLKYLGLIEADSNKDDVLNLRATVSNLKKHSLDFNWWSFPMMKESPNNPFDERMIDAW